MNIELSLGLLCLKFLNIHVHFGVVIFLLHSFFETTSKNPVTNPRISHRLYNFTSKSVISKFFFPRKLFSEVFVQSAPEVLTLEVLLQIFELDCSLHFTKNSLGSQNYLSVRRCVRYEIGLSQVNFWEEERKKGGFRGNNLTVMTAQSVFSIKFKFGVIRVLGVIIFASVSLNFVALGKVFA